MTLTISDVKYASFPLSFITIFFPCQGPKPNKGLSILPTSKQPITYSERWRKFISSVIITGKTSHPIARHAALAYSSGSQTFSEATISACHHLQPKTFINQLQELVETTDKMGFSFNSSQLKVNKLHKLYSYNLV